MRCHILYIQTTGCDITPYHPFWILLLLKRCVLTLRCISGPAQILTIPGIVSIAPWSEINFYIGWSMDIVYLTGSRADSMITLWKPVLGHLLIFDAMFIFCRFSAHRKMAAGYNIIGKRGSLPTWKSVTRDDQHRTVFISTVGNADTNKDTGSNSIVNTSACYLFTGFLPSFLLLSTAALAIDSLFSVNRFLTPIIISFIILASSPRADKFSLVDEGISKSNNLLPSSFFVTRYL